MKREVKEEEHNKEEEKENKDYVLKQSFFQ